MAGSGYNAYSFHIIITSPGDDTTAPTRPLKLYYLALLNKIPPSKPSFKVSWIFLHQKGKVVEKAIQDISVYESGKTGLYSFAIDVPTGLSWAKVEVSVGDGAGAREILQDTISGPALNTTYPVDLGTSGRGPRLVMALNHAVVVKPEERPDWSVLQGKLSRADPGQPGAADRIKIRYLINTIWEKLSEGLDEAWLSAYALGKCPVPAAIDATEKWARTVTEMFVGSPYAGPGQSMKIYDKEIDPEVASQMASKQQELNTVKERIKTIKQQQDVQLRAELEELKKTKTALETEIRRLRRKEYRGLPGGSDGPIYQKFSADDAAYPLLQACQHSTNFGVISYGYELTKKQIYFEAGPPSAKKISNDFGFTHREQEFIKKDHGKLSVKTDIDNLGPGSVYTFHPGANKDSAHIAFLLRVDKSLEEIQFFDVGGMNTPHRSPIPDLPGFTAISNATQTFDDPFTKFVPGPSDSKGTIKTAEVVGVPQPANIEKARTRLARTWPMGFARLVIRRRNNKELLFATPLLRMHLLHEINIFHVSRYFWSLREMPFEDEFEVVWQIDIPVNYTSRSFAILKDPEWPMGNLILKASRSDRTGDLVQRMIKAVVQWRLQRDGNQNPEELETKCYGEFEQLLKLSSGPVVGLFNVSSFPKQMRKRHKGKVWLSRCNPYDFNARKCKKGKKRPSSQQAELRWDAFTGVYKELGEDTDIPEYFRGKE